MEWNGMEWNGRMDGRTDGRMDGWIKHDQTISKSNLQCKFMKGPGQFCCVRPWPPEVAINHDFEPLQSSSTKVRI